MNSELLRVIILHILQMRSSNKLFGWHGLAKLDKQWVLQVPSGE